jgi:hypothetical protein
MMCGDSRAAFLKCRPQFFWIDPPCNLAGLCCSICGHGKGPKRRYLQYMPFSRKLGGLPLRHDLDASLLYRVSSAEALPRLVIKLITWASNVMPGHGGRCGHGERHFGLGERLSAAKCRVRSSSERAREPRCSRALQPCGDKGRV